MKELSLNILDIAQNSIAAGAKNIQIELDEKADGLMTLTITDDGCGMNEETLKTVTNPFYTTRTTRKVGMGIPLLKLACEQSGGGLTITSQTGENHGTVVTAQFDTKNIDFTPLGNITDTLCVLLQGNPTVDFSYKHSTPKGTVVLSTPEIKTILGSDIPLSAFEVLEWVRAYLTEQYDQIQ